MKLYDFLLIGQGLAGSTLALSLLKLGKKIMVLDNNYQKSSSRVAAGLFNPITGNQFAKSWKTDVIFPKLFQFYTYAEQLLESRFFFPTQMYRPFDSIEKQNAWLAESAEEEYKSYVDTENDCRQYDKTLFNEFGGITLKQVGYLNVKNYVEATQRYLSKQNAFLEVEFEEKELILGENTVTYKDITANHVVFCRGYKDATSSFWAWLPFSPVKGDMLFVNFENGNYQHIINRGCWILPMPEGYCKVGATYEWDELDENPTEKARKELTEKLEKLTRLPYTIQNQIAGVRPSSSDRKPFIGQHPTYKNCSIFNGFGTKGVSLVPHFAEHFVEHLTNKVTLDSEVDIKRVKAYRMGKY